MDNVVKESREHALQSPEQIGDHLRVTAVPTYLLAAAIIILLGAFIVWGFLGTVSDKAYYLAAPISEILALPVRSEKE